MAGGLVQSQLLLPGRSRRPMEQFSRSALTLLSLRGMGGLQLLEALHRKWGAGLDEWVEVKESNERKGPFMKRPVWNYPEWAGVLLKDLISGAILLELHSSRCFWCSSKVWDHDYPSWLSVWITWEAFAISPFLEFTPDQLNQNKDRDRTLDLFFLNASWVTLMG